MIQVILFLSVTRVVLRCRQLARERFAKLRSDVLVKLELLDQKHGEYTVSLCLAFILAWNQNTQHVIILFHKKLKIVVPQEIGNVKWLCCLNLAAMVSSNYMWHVIVWNFWFSSMWHDATKAAPLHETWRKFKKCYFFSATMYCKSKTVYRLWFNFSLAFNFIFLCFEVWSINLSWWVWNKGKQNLNQGYNIEPQHLCIIVQIS